MQQIFKLILDLLSIVAGVFCLILYLEATKELKKLKEQRDFLVHAFLTHMKDVAISNEQYEIAEQAKKLLEVMDDKMDGLEMTIFKASKSDKTKQSET